jgi:pimeloyl-ACP methyl ester carboxylesterase
MKIVYLHGANATGDSFNYIRSHITGYEEVVFEYNSKDGFYPNLETMKKKMHRIRDAFFVCHSLGGVYALHLADIFPKKVLGAITLSTPYGGTEAADYARYFLPFSRLLQDIGPNSGPMKTINNIVIQHPWTQIVTTSGNSPWVIEPNDGVVTLRSMRYRHDMTQIEVAANHYEIVMNSECVDAIKQSIKQIEKGE